MDVTSESFLAVVPAYNEAGSVANVVAALREQAPEFDVIVIDDGSTDATAEYARAAGAVVHDAVQPGDRRRGPDGFIYALEHGYEYMAQVDGDGQHEPSELRRLVAAMRADPGVDMVCGSRFVSDETDYNAPLSRRTGIRVFAFMLAKILRQPVTDPTSGFRLYNRRAIGLFAATTHTTTLRSRRC